MGRKPERTESLKRATYTMRVDQIEFLRTQPNASQFVRDAVDKIMQEKVSEVMSREAKILHLNKRLKEVGIQIENLEKEMREGKPGAMLFNDPFGTWRFLSDEGTLSFEEVAEQNKDWKRETLLYLYNLYTAYSNKIEALQKEREDILKQIAELGPG